MNDKNSHEFLLSLGFKKSYHSNHLCSFYELEGVINLKLYNSTRCNTIEDLIGKIADQSYELGRSDGSEQAHKKISNKLHEFIYSE